MCSLNMAAVTTWELCEAVDIGKPAFISIIQDLCTVGLKDTDKKTQSNLEVHLFGALSFL